MRRFLFLAAFLTAIQTNAPALLQTGNTLEGQLVTGGSDEFQLKLLAGQYAWVAVQQHTINVAIACFAPDGKEVLIIDGFQIGDAENAEFIAEVPGTYTVRLTAVEPHAPAGRYDITLRDVEPATERHRMRIAARRAFAEGMALHEEGTREAFLKGIGRFEDALTNWRGAHDLIEEARTLSSIGLMYIETGDQEHALKYMTDAVAVAQTSRDKKVEAHCLDFLAEVHNYFGDKRKAIDIYEQALPLLRDAGDRAFEGHTLNDLAVAYSGIGEKRKALSLFDQSIQILSEVQFRHMLAEVSGNRGMTFDYMGEYQRALENHQRELALLRELADHPSEAIVQNNIGSAYSGLGEFQKALDAYTAALEINRSVDNRWNVAINLNNIAWVHGQVGDAQRALKVYQEALDIMRAVKDQRRIAVTLNNIAEIYAGIGDYRNAIALHNEALPLRKIVGDADGEGNTLNNLGKAYAKLGEREKAREYFERALSIHRSAGNPNMLARTLRSLGALDREAGEFQHATAHLEESLQLTRSIHDRRGEADGLFELARVERSRGNLIAAHTHADDALSAMETVRLAVASPTLRASFFATARDIQELDIDILMRLHAQQPDNGFGATSLLASERGKARSLLEILGESGTEIRRGVDAALLDRERELAALIAAKAEQQTRLLTAKHTDADADAAEKEIDGLTAELEQVQSRIRTSSPQYAALMQPVPLDVKAIQKLLDPETVLLEYGLGADRSFLWAVTPTSLDIYNLPARAEIESATKRVHQLLTARNEKPSKETPLARAMRLRDADEAFRSAAAKVSNMLIGPAAARIANKRLLIAPEGVLQFLPFAALPDPAAADKSPLISGHEVVTVPSASLVDVLRRETQGREVAPKTLAVLADPVFSPVDARVAQANSRNNLTTKESEFLRLRFSRTEADEISRFVPAESTLKALDFDANRDAVLNGDLGQYRIVHFATHSLLNNEHPELSGVVLSLVDRSGRPQNGFLRLYDIYNLRLSSDLVVLSACETALGGEIKGEGLIGLTRGFLYAGAPRVVASLWEIDDRTTADLMKKFYEAMLVHGERPAAALRAAQMAILKTKGLESPYYWAAFTIQGEWR